MGDEVKYEALRIHCEAIKAGIHVIQYESLKVQCEAVGLYKIPLVVASNQAVIAVS